MLEPTRVLIFLLVLAVPSIVVGLLEVAMERSVSLGLAAVLRPLAARGYYTPGSERSETPDRLVRRFVRGMERVSSILPGSARSSTIPVIIPTLLGLLAAGLLMIVACVVVPIMLGLTALTTAPGFLSLPAAVLSVVAYFGGLWLVRTRAKRLYRKLTGASIPVAAF